MRKTRQCKKAPAGAGVKRLNWGCGEHTAPGWINSDLKTSPHVDMAADIREGLPLDDASMEYAVSVHALPELPYPEIVPVLRELHRVLEPGGVLRLALPDLRKGIRAYTLGHDDHFQVGDEVASAGGRFIVHMLWYGYTRTLFTSDFAAELLEKAGFVDIAHCGYGETANRFPAITELDNRPEESFFVEGSKPRDPDAHSPPPAASGGGEHVDRGPPLIEVLSVTHAPEDGTLEGFRIGRPKPGESLHSRSMPVVGWVLGARSPAVSVELISGGETVAESPVQARRPDLVEAFPDLEGIETAGFSITMEGAGYGRSTVEVVAVLEDGSRAAIGTIDVLLPKGAGEGQGE